MKYRHQFEVNAPLNKVAQFHRRSQSMADITPPPVKVQIHHAPAELADGDEMDFTLRLGPLPIRWAAQIKNVNPTGFTDRQLRGPFRHWAHRHTFEPVDDNTTTVVDEIEFSLKPHPCWGLVGLGMAISLPFLFFYRGWKTRQLLAHTLLNDTPKINHDGENHVHQP